MKEASDLFALGEDVINKQSLATILPHLIQAGTDVSGITGNISDFQAELAALLANPAADADLLAYAMTLVSGESAKAQALIQASAKLAIDVVLDVNALVAAFKLPSAPATTPA